MKKISERAHQFSKILRNSVTKKAEHVRNKFANTAIVCFLQIIRTLNSEEMMAVSPK